MIKEAKAKQLTNSQIIELRSRLQAFREGRMKTISGENLHNKLIQKTWFFFMNTF